MNAKAAIMESFKKLINQRPVDQITIRDIVNDCGVNRNSFYYHFDNMETLVEAVVVSEAEAIISQYPEFDSVERCMNAMIEFCMTHRRALMNIYSTVHRRIFERKLMELCEKTLLIYIEKSPLSSRTNEEEKKAILSFYKCECFGQIIEWLESSMTYDLKGQFHQICSIGGRVIGIIADSQM